MKMILLAATLVLLSLLAPSASQEANTTFPLTYRAKAAEGGEQLCSSDDLRRHLQIITRNDLSNLLRNNNLQALVPCSNRNLGQVEHCPAASCSDIVVESQVLRSSGYYWIISSSGTVVRLYCDMDAALCNLGRGTTQNNTVDSCSDVTYTCLSGYYWFRSSNGTAVRLYCDMNVTRCNLGRGLTQNNPADSCSDVTYTCPSGYYWVRTPNGTAVQVYCDVQRLFSYDSTGPWTRIAYLNMTDPSQQCPSAWTLQTRSSEPRRLCGKRSSGASCESVVYSTFGINYSHVCGRVIAYQYGSPDAFHESASQTIEGPYVDGVSVTHGSPVSRQHIWTFAAGLVESNPLLYPTNSCPCADRATALSLVPSFVGNDYFCESGNPTSTYSTTIFYTNDPLWDGRGCGAASCCELSYPPGVTPPWFCKQLPQATTDDIEVRLCGYEGNTNEDTPVELIELYIN